jgi:hypothetical protein
MREVIDEHHIDGRQNNLLIGEVDSKGEEEASDNEQGDSENQLTPQELLINYALTLDVEGNGDRVYRLVRSGQEDVIYSPSCCHSHIL